ncbi:MAG: DUF4290 domain-containing protein [Bacteroidota bacterium]
MTHEKPLILREYGRNIQKIVAHILTVEDKVQRKRYVEATLKLMGLLSPYVKQSAEYLQKRWSDLFVIADYKLDVEGAYPKPTKERAITKPIPLTYQTSPVKYRHYGRHVELLVQKAAALTDVVEQERFVVMIAKLIKNLSTTWNRDNLDYKGIRAIIQEIADRKLAVDLEKIKIDSAPQPAPRARSKPSRKGRIPSHVKAESV